MNRNVAWGAGALLAIAAVFGIVGRVPRSPVASSSAASEANKGVPPTSRENVLSTSVCADPERLLQEFFLAGEGDVAAPDSCYPPNFSLDTNAKNRLQTLASHLNFIVAVLPDPLHTHLSLLFDRKIEAIQQAAQDAGYDYDSSWLPWETEAHTFTHLADQDEIDDRKDAREEQPGLILFRKRSNKPGEQKNAEEPFQEGLAVFVVGEEATRGIHRRQFQNAAAWIAVLQPHIGICVPIAILGPTFSGSLPSLAELMANKDVQASLNYKFVVPGNRVRIYSGSISGKEAAEAFGVMTSSSDDNLKLWNVEFHSFIESDDRILDDYCAYLKSEGLRPDRVAFISEDETAYGIGGINDKGPCPGAVRLFYPRDISALRAAYQTQSIFSPPGSQESADTQRRTLPTDLADPAGEAHDTVRSYGGNQTPLAQEAQLLGIVGVLHDHRSEYLVIRSSNTLDQLFLANFFRRVYPEGRIGIRGADTFFLRERGPSGISGVVMLSTYPLIPWDWRDWLDQSRHPTHRIFGEETVEGTYIAARFLIQEDLKGVNATPPPLGTGRCVPPPIRRNVLFPPITTRVCRFPTTKPHFGRCRTFVNYHQNNRMRVSGFSASRIFGLLLGFPFWVEEIFIHWRRSAEKTTPPNQTGSNTRRGRIPRSPNCPRKIRTAGRVLVAIGSTFHWG